MNSGLLRLTFVSLAVLALGIALPAAASAASAGISPAEHRVLPGKVPVCSGNSGAILLGGPHLYGANPGPGSGPDQQVRDGRFFDAIGSEWLMISVDSPAPCPGPPSDIKVLSPIEATTCSSMELLTLEITDLGGYNVKDGTPVSLSTNLGSLPESVATKDGLAYASYLAPSETPGKAEIVVRAGAVIALKTIVVACG